MLLLLSFLFIGAIIGRGVIEDDEEEDKESLGKELEEENKEESFCSKNKNKRN